MFKISCEKGCQTPGFAYDHRDHKVKSVLIEAIKESNCDMNVLEPIYI